MDVWIADVKTGHPYNANRRAGEIVRPGAAHALVLTRRRAGHVLDAASGGPQQSVIGVWAVAALGGEPQLYLEGAAEFDWSGDVSQLVYHTTAAGDPTFIRTAGQGAKID